jgi:hypothetical protein
MAEPKQSAFEGWAVVELMGHQREIGFVTTEAYGQAVMFRVDAPELPEREFVLTAPEYANISGSVDDSLRQWCPTGSKVKRAAVPARTRLIAPGSLYAINPCTEEAARTAMERSVSRPLILVEVAPGKALPPPEERDDDLFDDAEEHDEVLY